MRSMQTKLSLSNVTIIEDELEKYAHSIIAKDSCNAIKFDLITFRAFRPLEPKILKGLFRLCSNKGVLAAYKGRSEKIDAELVILKKSAADSGAKSKMQLTSCEVIPCPTPLLDEERHIVLIRGKYIAIRK